MEDFERDVEVATNDGQVYLAFYGAIPEESLTRFLTPAQAWSLGTELRTKAREIDPTGAW